MARGVETPLNDATVQGDVAVPEGSSFVVFAHGSGSSRHRPRFDIDLLAHRLVGAVDGLGRQSESRHLAVETVLARNFQAEQRMRCRRRLEVVPGATPLFEEPGALEQVAAPAADWFTTHLSRVTSAP